MSGADVEPVSRDFAAGGAALAEFALGLTASSSLEELELLDDVADGEDRLYRLLARRPGDGRV